jgi:hypothetical protein
MLAADRSRNPRKLKRGRFAARIYLKIAGLVAQPNKTSTSGLVDAFNMSHVVGQTKICVGVAGES